MATAQTNLPLAAFPGRAAGTDAERRAALALADDVRRGGREPRIDPFWCRPNGALAHAWHAVLALAGSLLCVSLPAPGLGLLGLALASIVADALFGVSPGRRLTTERASQNVVVGPRPHDPDPRRAVPARPGTRLVLVAGYDTARVSMLGTRPAIAAGDVLRRATRGRAPGWLAWLALAVAWLVVIAGLRLHGDGSRLIEILQLIPSIALVLALAALLDAAAGPATADDDSAVVLALAVLRALDAAPPANLSIELVFCGAHEAGAIGVRRHLRAHRRELRRGHTIVVGLAGCTAGDPRWWVSDGPLIALRCPTPLRRMLARIADRRPDLRAGPHCGRGQSPAYPALLRRLSATTLGAVASPDSTRRGDQSPTPEESSPGTQTRVLDLALELVDALDAHLAPSVASREAARQAIPA